MRRSKAFIVLPTACVFLSTDTGMQLATQCIPASLEHVALPSCPAEYNQTWH